DIIQQAKTEIDAVYFLARNDRITLSALALLRDARRRGVPNVRLIVDANFQHIPKAVLAHIREEGVQVKVYHPLTLRHPGWLFSRMHEKVVVADGKRYVTGGRNLAEAYFALAKRNFVDRDVYVDGASAAEAQRYFENLWTSENVAELHVHVPAVARRSASCILDAALHDLEREHFIALDMGTDWSAGRRDAGPVQFLHDRGGENRGEVGAEIADIIDGAKRSIVIESPYLVPSKSLLELLEKKSAEGVYILIVTNSFRSTDGVLPYAGYIKYRRRVLRAGIDIAEFKGPDTLHAKTMVIDGRTVLIGSYNLDPRSQNLNTEVMCVARDAAIAGEVLDSIAGHVADSWRAGRRGESPPHERSFSVWALRLLLPVFENQL
ncbi:MAG TPA: phosphatidylserine/phosphatidylglycerophosphate/cardiolipin synthase family protein, partial [Thermoanaerobaculia bacterium]|nr:phosphatidylserine/phosphatidylglycerophosphate/cardiolipin synthase family protein [Thermoanaerobaculia bacterium]